MRLHCVQFCRMISSLILATDKGVMRLLSLQRSKPLAERDLAKRQYRLLFSDPELCNHATKVVRQKVCTTH